MSNPFQLARQAEWDRADLNGRPLAHICPICGAFVPLGNDVAGVAYRERHIQHHEREATR